MADRHRPAPTLPAEWTRAIVLRLLLLLGGLGGLGCAKKSSPPAGPLIHEAYLWQDPNRPQAAAALARARGKLSCVAILAAEGAIREGNLSFREIPNLPKGPDFAYVIRIGQSGIGFLKSSEHHEMVTHLVKRLARNSPREIQIDFDCPTSRLVEYKQVLDSLRAAASPVPIAFTALPSWLATPDFATLARAFPRYVLQVHSLDLPSSHGEPVVLCDPAAARCAAEKAASIGVAFRLALPTYGSELLFDADGRVLDVVSEDASRVPTSSIARRERVFASPKEMAALVREWSEHRPRELIGICWYRLPVEGDRRNWTWATFSQAIEGKASVTTLEIHANPGEGGVFHITLFNPGQGHAPMPKDIPLPEGTLAADATRPYHLSGGELPVLLHTSADPIWPWLAPGERLVVGWFRHPNPPSNLSSPP